MKLRPYQVKCVRQALKFFQKDKVFRIDACTGAGKTVMATEIAKSYKNVVFVCHTNNLLDQLQSSVELTLKRRMPDSWSSYTYQTLRTKTKKDHKEIDLLVVDEGHQGGLSKDDVSGSYRQIIKNLKPKKILVLSATDHNLDASIFGKKTSENTFRFTYRDGMVAGVLNNCDLITIHTGLKQFISDDTVIDGPNLSVVKKKAAKRKVNLVVDESKDNILKAHLTSAAEVYLTQECNVKKGYYPQAVFFVSNKTQADILKKALYDRMLQHTKDNKNKRLPLPNLVQISHSGITESTEIIQFFKNKEFSCLVNIKQIQEGFDYPDLDLIFDCSPSFSNRGRVFFQRLGRCLRTNDEKKPSRYYFLYRLSAGGKFDGTKAAGDNLSVVDLPASEARDEHLEAIGEANRLIEGQGIDGGVAYKGIEIDQNALNTPTAIPVGNMYSGMLDDLASDKPKNIYISSSRLIVKGADGEAEIKRRSLFDMLRESDAPWNSFTTPQEMADFLKKYSGVAS
jgi:superfamily II DNA or RNA helicase